MMAEVNKHLDQSWMEEQTLLIVFGNEEMFHKFLQKYATFQKEVEQEQEKQKSWF
jgi:hypothetical protein